MSKDPSIVVIGAGASGIAAATKLLENGFSNVVVLEAEDRIGGRVYSEEFGGSFVDVGGQWVHGEKGNVVYEMVKDLDLLSPSHNTYDDNTYYMSNGNVADKSITDRLRKIGMDVIGDADNAKNYSGTFGEYFLKVYNENVLKEFGKNKEVLKLSKMMESWIHKFFTCLDSTKTWYDVSTTGPYVFQKSEGNQQLNWRDKGYRTILYILMKKIPDITKQLPMDDKILLNKEVTEIKWNSDSDAVKITCVDGSSYDANHVIVTVSLGVLKKNYKTMFVPELPSYKINSIEGIGFGTVNKILLKFPTKWWPDDLKGFSLLWTEEDRINLVNECPHFGPVDDEGRSWLEDVYGFYVIDSNPKVLLGWVVGKMAAEVEYLSDEVVTSSCMYLLKKFVGNKYDIPAPDGVLRSKWSSNQHFCGSYAHINIETEKRKASAEDLARPLTSKNNNPIVQFAGEATNATKFSTVNGAIETGYREAERLINLYKDFEYYEIVILGAGMAGIGAAAKLIELGYKKFIILEAQDQAGGRIRTITVDGKPLDVGAQWLHGKDNALYEIAVKYNLLSDKTSEEGLGIFVRNDGEVLDEFLVKSIDFQIGKILEECQRFVNDIEFPTSVGDFMRDKYVEYLDSCEDDQETISKKLDLFDWHVRFQVIDNSCHNLGRLSAKYWGSYICLDDTAHYNLKDGYQSLIDVIIDELPKNSIRLNTEVNAIDYSNGDIKLTCSDNKLIYCKHMILTTSIGVLKDLCDITPPLPHFLKDSIANIGFYGIAKIYLFYEERWWGDLKGIQFVWKTDTVLEKDEEWMKHMTGFDDVFDHPNVLVGWVGSDGVKQIEDLSENIIGILCTKRLRIFLKNVCHNIPEPTKVLRTRWFSNPWIKGSYCHITPECDHSGSVMDKLAQPVFVENVPRIILAGEAVHPSHYSTTHGAYESGLQQAALLYEYIMEQENNFFNK